MPSIKRSGDDAVESPAANKYRRTDGHGQDAGHGRKKTGAPTRTGQACDRCKVRKIRCDARPGGCSPCLQNNAECKTTDRITGRATSRGYTETLENENMNLKMYIIELQAQLKHNGLEPGPPPQVPPGYPPTQMPYGMSWNSEPQDDGYVQAGQAGQAGQAEYQESMGSLLPTFRSGCIGDNYLGVVSENSWLSPVEGTSLSLFGTKIDVTEFMPPESNPDASAMSYQTFLQHAFGGSKPAKTPELPDYEQCSVFAQWYFRTIQVFTPVLHKPDFMNLLDKLYHKNYEPTPAETVMVHMMLAVMHFQWSARNGNEQGRNISFDHFHYSLTFIPQLIANHNLEDIQALTLICGQLRNHQRPGAAWMFTNMVLGLAIESGLHRSAKSWRSPADERDEHTIEMRKRVFWSLMVYHVALSGKLGRPMPLRFEDFDIEIPEAVDDNLPSESNMPKWRKCSWRAAIEGFKLVKIMMRIHNTIYAIRSTPGPYEADVRQLEKDLHEFELQVPPELSGGPQTLEEDRMPALYLQLTIAECELRLHHPSLCRSNSPKIMSSNLDLCLIASSRSLGAAVQLKQLKALDTTWYHATDFLAAIFTTLFVFTERRDQINSVDWQHLRRDMDAWLDVTGELGRMLGTGTRLQDAVRNIIDSILGTINRHLNAKTASAAIASADDSSTSPAGQEQPPPQHLYGQSDDFYSANNSASDGDMSRNQPRQYSVEGKTGQATQTAQQYAPRNQYTYPEPRIAFMANQSTYPTVPGYDASTYGAEAMKNNIEAQLNAGLSQPAARQPTPQNQQQTTPHQHQTAHFMAALRSPVHQNGFQPPAAATGMQQGLQSHGPAAWRQFADNMMMDMNVQPDISGQPYAMSPVNPLLGLQSNADKPEGTMTAAIANGSGAPSTNFAGMQMPADTTQMWPLIQYQGGPTTDGS